MRQFAWLILWIAAPAFAAPPVYRADELLAGDRPEAWAMQYLAAAALPTGFAAPALAAGEWRAAAELAHVPSLSERQRTVGFEGSKLEDLNKSPVVGRVRVDVGLPAHWRLEAGWTPPVAIDGTRPRALFALAIGRRLAGGEAWVLHARAFGQHGSVSGDITCPKEVAGSLDPDVNPYACDAPSDDTWHLRQYGLELDGAWDRGPWRGQASVGAVRNELAVQLDALTGGVRDRSRLASNTWRPFVTLGAQRAFGERWRLSVQWLHVPLRVRRGPGADREGDDFGGLRAQLAWSPR